MTAPSMTFTPWHRLRDHSGRPWSFEAQVVASLLGALFLFSLASLLYLSQASYAASASETIKQQQIEKQRLEWQKAELERDIAGLTAPDALMTRAGALGYGPPKATLYIAANAAQPAPPSSQNPVLPALTNGDWWSEIWQPLAAWLDARFSTDLQRMSK